MAHFFFLCGMDEVVSLSHHTHAVHVMSLHVHVCQGLTSERYAISYFQAIQKPLQMKYILRPMPLWTTPLKLFLTSLDFSLGSLLTSDEDSKPFWDELGSLLDGYLFVLQ